MNDTIPSLLTALSLKREMMLFSDIELLGIIVNSDNDGVEVSAQFRVFTMRPELIDSYRVLSLLVMDLVERNRKIFEELSYRGLKDFCENNGFDLDIIEDGQDLVSSEQLDYLASVSDEDMAIVFIVDLNVGG